VTDQVHKLGEVLRAAREAKGVDLTRVERETKIRERYLSALERGEYRELPGSVYTKGFLRNYGSYLGLDPEYLIDLYRLESSSPAVERPSAPSPPRPIAGRRARTFVVTPNAVVAAILTLLVGGFFAYLGYEFVNFARTPELRITDPVGNVNGYAELTMTVRGVTAPNATVTVSNLRENPSVEADADGSFEIDVELVPGSNVMRLIARDPVTGRDSEIEERTVVVVTDDGESPTPEVVALTVSEPAMDATSTGTVTISGTASPSAAVAVSAVLATPATPTFRVTDPSGTAVAIEPADPTAPESLALTADPSGAFSGSMSLAAGGWDLTIVTDGVEPVVRRVTVVPGEGLRGTIRVTGGDSYLEVEEDGTPIAGVSGGIVADGETVELAATDDLRIRAGNAGAVHITLNGIVIGEMGGDGAVVEWRITREDG